MANRTKTQKNKKVYMYKYVLPFVFFFVSYKIISQLGGANEGGTREGGKRPRE